MRSIEAVRRHPVVAYVLVACGLSWAYWIPMALRGEMVTAGGSVSHFPGLFGPAIGAVLITMVVDGRAGLRNLAAGIVRWRVSPALYAMAGVPVGILLVAIALTSATGGQWPTMADFARYTGLPSLAVPLVVILVLAGAYGEEAGWRGFLTPRLLERHGPLTASLVVAGVWFSWHAPLFWVVDTYRAMGIAIVPMLGLGLVSGAIVLTWLYAKSGGSVLIVALWHTALNLGSATTAGSGLAGMLIWFATLVWAIAVVIGWLIAGEPATRPFGARLRDGTLIALLRSPFGRLIGGMAVVTFRGRRSGRVLATPVECVFEPSHLFVFVGNADQKQWWRNVQADPQVTLDVRGQRVPGMARVAVGADPEVEPDLAAYIERRPRIGRALGVSVKGPLDHASFARATERVVSVRIDFSRGTAG